MSDNQIQNIADEIKDYKPKTFIAIFEKGLKDLNVPFPDKIEYYLNLMMQNTGLNSNSSINIQSVNHSDNKYKFEIIGQPFSYLEVNGIGHNFPKSGTLELEVEEDPENPFFYAKFLWAPYDKTLPEGYQKPEDNEYLANITSYVSFPDHGSGNDHKGYVTVGYLTYGDYSNVLFPNHVIVAPDEEDTRKLFIANLLPNTKYKINGTKFTTSVTGQFIIEDGVKFAETFSELKTSLTVETEYEGKFKNYLNLTAEAILPKIDLYYRFDRPTVFDPHFFISPGIFTNNGNYWNHIVNRYYEPLEVEYLGETLTIPVGQKSMEFDEKISGSMLSKIKPGTTEVKIKIKNDFKYPWVKEQKHPASDAILNKNCIQNLFNYTSTFYQSYTFDELKEFNFDGNKVNLQKNDYGYNTEINKYVYVVDNILKTLEETDESGAVDLVTSQKLPKNINGLRFVPFASNNRQSTTEYNYNISNGDKIKSINSIKAYKKDGSYHVIVDYNTETQNNMTFKIGNFGEFIPSSMVEDAIGFIIMGQTFDSL